MLLSGLGGDRGSSLNEERHQDLNPLEKCQNQRITEIALPDLVRASLIALKGLNQLSRWVPII